MVYEERNTWASLVVTVIALTVYVIVVLQQADGGPLSAVDWWPIMLWTIIGSIVGAIVLSILWGIAAGSATPTGSASPTSVTAISPAAATGSDRRSW